MKRICFILLTIVGLTSITNCQPVTYQSEKLQKIWEISGLSTPESVLPVPEKEILYVSNIGVTGSPDSEQNGFISILNSDGSIKILHWVTGLNAPKGMAISEDKLYVTEVNSIAEIEISSGTVLRLIHIEGAHFLNDIAADISGDLYISDSKTGSVFRVSKGEATTFIQSSDFGYPNGLVLDGNKLLLGTGDKIVCIDVKTRKVEDYMLNTGGVDGLTILAPDFILFSNWKGTVYTLKKGFEKELLLDTSTTESVKSADFGYDASKNSIYVPTFFGNSVVCYKLSLD